MPQTLDFRLSPQVEAAVIGIDRASQVHPPEEVSDPGQVTPFHSSVPPPITLLKYAERIAVYSGYGDGGIALGTALVARFLAAQRIPLNVLTVHRVLLTAVTIAAKAHLDHFVNNKYMALVGGIPLSEINALEVLFLSVVEFEAIPKAAEVSRCLAEVAEIVLSGHQGGGDATDAAVSLTQSGVRCLTALVRIGQEEGARRKAP